MAEYVAPVLTVPQARELREAAKRWWVVKSMTDGPGRDMAAARATLNAIRALDAVLPGDPALPSDPAAPGTPSPNEGTP